MAHILMRRDIVFVTIIMLIVAVSLLGHCLITCSSTASTLPGNSVLRLEPRVSPAANQADTMIKLAQMLLDTTTPIFEAYGCRRSLSSGGLPLTHCPATVDGIQTEQYHIK